MQFHEFFSKTWQKIFKVYTWLHGMSKLDSRSLIDGTFCMPGSLFWHMSWPILSKVIWKMQWLMGIVDGGNFLQLTCPYVRWPEDRQQYFTTQPQMSYKMVTVLHHFWPCLALLVHQSHAQTSKISGINLGSQYLPAQKESAYTLSLLVLASWQILGT